MTILTSQLIIGVIMVLLAFISYKANKVKLSTSMITKLALLITLSVLLGSIFKISLHLFGAATFEIKFDYLPHKINGILFRVNIKFNVNWYDYWIYVSIKEQH